MALLTVNGGIRATGDVTAFYSSDERLKENIKVIEDALEKISEVRGVTYDWKEGYEDIEGKFDEYFRKESNAGIIAQDLEKAMPDSVRLRPNGFKAVDYLGIIALLVASVNELREKVEKLEGK